MMDITISTTLKVPASVQPGNATTQDLSSASSNGVTFNFDKAYPVGNYGLDSFFVVAPAGVTITSTSPASVTDSTTKDEDDNVLTDRTRHGMGSNPRAIFNPFDSNRDGTSVGYQNANNIDPGNTGASYTAQPGETLFKALSIETPNKYARPSVERFVSITVLSQAPLEGSFRPAPTGDLNPPETWRDDQVDWSQIPSIGFTSYPKSEIDFTSLTEASGILWQTWVLWGNGSRSFTPLGQPGPYRREVGEFIGRCIVAVCSDAPRSSKEPLLRNLIQLGIDQAGALPAYEEFDSGESGEEKRFDIGRRALTALAAAVLPDNQVLLDALGNTWRWQDVSSHDIITTAAVNAFDNETGQGALPGMEGLPDWVNSRAENIISGVNHSTREKAYGYYALEGTKHAAYRKIGIASQFLGSTAIHLIGGARATYNYDVIVQYNDRWDNLVSSGWPGVGGVDDQGNPTGYMGNTVAGKYFDFFREVRGLLPVSPLSGVAPESPEPPTLTAAGTTITVTPTSPFVGHGAALTQTDVRYAPLSDAGGTWSRDGVWVEQLDVTLAQDGTHEITGLSAGTRYAVSIRYHNSNGPGAWSRNWRHDNEPTGLPFAAWVEAVVDVTS